MGYKKCKTCDKVIEEVVVINGEKRCPICESNQVVRVVSSDNAGEIEIPLNKS
jgi:RNA polymerase subunit RPABC4/transcription elongation factor Spt4